MIRRLVLVAAIAGSIHCSASPSAEPPANARASADAGADAAAASTAPVVVPIEVRSYRTLGGKFLRASVVVNGSAPIPVLLDTGSTGLRVFASAITSAAVPVEDTGEAESIEFPAGVLKGKRVRARVGLGDATTPEPIAIQRIDEVTCGPGTLAMGCDPSNAVKQYTDDGIFGILGVGLRADPSGIVSPLAQMADGLSRGFALHTGGYDAKAGELVLGAAIEDGFAAIPLARAGALPNGAPAWADDAVSICYSVDGVPVDPPCSDSVLDTGSNMDVLYAKNVASAKLTNDGMLARGVTFGAKRDGAFDLVLRVAEPVTVGKDAVLVQADDPFTILGLGLFFRYDAVFDIAGGRIGLRPR